MTLHRPSQPWIASLGNLLRGLDHWTRPPGHLQVSECFYLRYSYFTTFPPDKALFRVEWTKKVEQSWYVSPACEGLPLRSRIMPLLGSLHG